MGESWLHPPVLKKMPQISSSAAARLLGTEALGQGKSRLLQVPAAGIPFPSLLRHMGTFLPCQLALERAENTHRRFNAVLQTRV